MLHAWAELIAASLDWAAPVEVSIEHPCLGRDSSSQFQPVQEFGMSSQYPLVLPISCSYILIYLKLK